MKLEKIFLFVLFGLLIIITLSCTNQIELWEVSFVSNGGSSVESIPVLYNAKINEPTEPTKEGYIFAGWYKDDKLTKKWKFQTDKVKFDTTLYAKWEIQRWTVTFNSNGGSTVNSKTADYDTTITAPSDPEKEGFEFIGWYKESSLTTEWNFATDKFTNNTTLYAKWNINSYTVTFNSNGGPTVNSKTADYNTKITAPSDPEKEGYEFIGWYKESSLTAEWDFDTDKVTNDITLYAKWIKLWEVTFNSIGGSDVSSQIIREGNEVTVPASPTKTGHTFGGWYKESTLANAWDFTTDTVTADITLYAKWNINSYTVTFDSNGGTSVTEQSIKYNAYVSIPLSSTKTGYTFVGWYKEASLETAWNFSTNTVTKDTTLYAKWTINEYTVTFDSNGGNSVDSQSIEYNSYAEEPNEPIKTDCDFIGWYSNEELTNSWDFTTDKITENTTLYAKWMSFSYVYNMSINSTVDLGSSRKFSLYDKSENEIAIAKLNSDSTTLSINNEITDDYYFAYIEEEKVAKVIIRNGRAKIVDKDTETPMTKGQLKSLISNCDDDANLNYIETFGVTDMSSIFYFANTFNGNISGWDVSNVTYMSYMFSFASLFNGDISGWDVSNVTNMSYMFDYARSFNQNLTYWDVSNVTNMSYMFNYARSFNGDISDWEVGNVKNMYAMFSGAKAFNGDISGWEVGNVENMYAMFYGAKAFNGDISDWEVGNVTDMSSMFANASLFNQDLKDWDVNNVTNMSYMFYGAESFNQNLTDWEVDNVTNMSYMFYEAIAFNKNISGWNVNNVTNWDYIFNSCPIENDYKPAKFR